MDEPTVVQSSILPVVDRKTCQNQYFYDKELYFTITKDMFCAGSIDSHVCKGDSGGPAVDFNGELVGIASWGQRIPCSNGPDVFTNEFNYRDWIEKNINHEKNDNDSISDRLLTGLKFFFETCIYNVRYF